MAEATSPAPVSAEATGMSFSPGGAAPASDPTFVNAHALTLLAHNLPQIEWSFDEVKKTYFGKAPYGEFELTRGASGKLVADFRSTCGSHSAHMGLNETSVAEAKAAILPRILDALNQSRRLELIVPTAVTAEAVVTPEPDLI